MSEPAETDSRQSTKSATKIAKIIDHGRDIFIQEGYAAMTIRRVAEEMGISAGNLTYHFPTKDLLLQAIIEDCLERLEKGHDKAASHRTEDPATRMRAYLEFLIEDSQQTSSQKFFYQLWILTAHNKNLQSYKDRVYQHFLSNLMIELDLSRPDLRRPERRKKAFLVMSAIEGMNVLFGTSVDFRTQFGKLSGYLLDQLLLVIFVDRNIED